MSLHARFRPAALVLFASCVAALLFLSSPPSVYGADTASLTINGSRFTIETFDNDVKAYGNRDYLWKEIPGRFRGWQFTRTRGGEHPRMEFTPEKDCTVYAATLAQTGGFPALGWEEMDGEGFNYTTPHFTRMVLLKRHCKAGERVEVPQANWSGTIVLAPKLVMGKPLKYESGRVPGVVIDKSPDPATVYIGSPSIAILPNGHYVASHDLFGKGTTFDQTVVLGSRDRGATWAKLSQINGQFWSTLFVHRNALYIIGAGARYGNTVIRRSDDGGKTWTTPADSRTGLLLDDGKYHCAPMPVVRHTGRLWRAMEDGKGPGGWPTHFRSFVMSVPEDADLLDASNWTFSNRLEYKQEWYEAKNGGWLEGNIVVTPDSKLVNILRFNDDRGDVAAIVDVSDDGKTGSFDPASGFIDFPGGRTKFTIRFDPVSKRYWTLANKQTDPPAFRNILVLTSSADLRTWKVESTILEHWDQGGHAFQYVDWVFDGDDIIAASRTAWDGAHNAHDANYLTFHRVKDFRSAGPNAAR